MLMPAMRRLGLLCVFWLSLGAALIGTAQADQEAIITTAPPKGFESLLEPQMTLVDVWFNGRRLGESMVSYTPETLTFENPQQIVQWLGSLNSSQEILAELSIPLPANQQKVCRYQEQPDCGLLEPETVGIIFDEANFRVDVFVNPRFLPTQKLSLNKFLPASASEPALINRFSLLASGQEQGEDNYSAVVDSLAAWKNYRLRSNFLASDQESLQLERFSLAYEFKDFSWQVGSFRNRLIHQSLMPQRDMLGFRVATSFNSRTDLEQVSGTRLSLFLQERSRVEAYKDGQLIASRIYPAGNVELDTQDFPDGAYQVRLVVRGDSGREKISEQFFSKSLLLVPKGEHQFFFETGYLEKTQQTTFFPEKDSPLLFRVGYGGRPADFWGYNLTLNSVHRQNLLEMNHYLLGNATELQSTVGLTDDGDYSLLNQLDIRLPAFFMSLNYRKSITNNTLSDVVSVTEDGMPNFRFIENNSRQVSFVAGVPTDRGNLNLFARRSQSDSMVNTESFGLSWRQNIFRQGNLLFDGNLEVSKENGAAAIYAGFSLRYQTARWHTGSSLSLGREELDDRWHDAARFEGQIGYRDFSNTLGQWNSNLLLTRTQQILAAQQNAQRVTAQTLSWQNELRNEFGSGRLELEQRWRDGERKTGYALESRFNLVTTGGSVSLGGDQQNVAGVMIRLSDYEKDDLFFTVLVNGRERAVIRPGHTSFIALEPYQSYQLQLAPRGSDLVQYDDSVKQFTLYPGNVEHFDFELLLSRVFIMQVLNQQLQPLANARAILDRGYGRTDDKGWIQLEMSAGTNLQFEQQGKRCEVAIDWQQYRDSVNFLDQVICQPVSNAGAKSQ